MIEKFADSGDVLGCLEKHNSAFRSVESAIRLRISECVGSSLDSQKGGFAKNEMGKARRINIMPKFFYTDLFFWIFAVLGCAAVYGEYWTSARGYKFGTTEQLKIQRDKYGIFSSQRYWIFHGILIAVGFVFYFLIGGQAGFWFVMVFGLSLFKAIANYIMQEGSRKKQILFLTALSTVTDSEEDKARMGGVLSTLPAFHKFSGRTWNEDYQWLFSDNPDDWQAQHEIFEKLIALSRRPASEWFK